MFGVQYVDIFGAAPDSEDPVVVAAEEGDGRFVRHMPDVPVAEEFGHIVDD